MNLNITTAEYTRLLEEDTVLRTTLHELAVQVDTFMQEGYQEVRAHTNEFIGNLALNGAPVEIFILNTIIIR